MNIPVSRKRHSSDKAEVGTPEKRHKANGSTEAPGPKQNPLGWLEDAKAKLKARAEAAKKKMEEVRRQKLLKNTINNAKVLIGDSKVSERDARIAALMKNINSKNQSLKGKLSNTSPMEEDIRDQRGLDVPLHPLLLNPSLITKKEPTKTNIKKGPNPLLNPIEPEDNRNNPYFDSSLDTRRHERTHRDLIFNQKGKYIAKAQELRRKLEMEERKRKFLEKSKAIGLEPDTTIYETKYKVSRPPIIEWWDEPLLKDKDYEHINDSTRLNIDCDDPAVDNLILHPIPIPTPWGDNSSTTSVLYMTKKELKKKRRNERQERHKVTQDRVRLGLDAAPPPKVKLSNLMSALSHEYIQDPTQVEMRVRNEIKGRYDTHVKMNEDRKLTPEQRHEKQKKKDEERKKRDGVYSAIFKIDKLVDPQHKYKVDINAKQLDFTGLTVIGPKFSMIIVEGTIENINKYKKLLFNRIKWTENAQPRPKSEDNDDEPEEEPADVSGNKCSFVWEGPIRRPYFKKWTTTLMDDEEKILELLEKHNVQMYWIECKTFQDDY